MLSQIIIKKIVKYRYVFYVWDLNIFFLLKKISKHKYNFYVYHRPICIILQIICIEMCFMFTLIWLLHNKKKIAKNIYSPFWKTFPTRSVKSLQRPRLILHLNVARSAVHCLIAYIPVNDAVYIYIYVFRRCVLALPMKTNTVRFCAREHGMRENA